MSIKDLVVTSRRFFSAFVTRANKATSPTRVWQIGPAVVAFPEDGPIAFCTTGLSHRLEDRPLQFQVTGEPLGSLSVATWEPLERTEDDDKHRKAANRALSLLNAESPVTINVNPKLLTEALALMEGEECVLSLLPSNGSSSCDPWIAVRVRDDQSIAMVAPCYREGLINTTGTWCDRYPRPNAAKPEIDPPDDWFCISDGDYPDDGDDCTVAFMDADGKVRAFRGTWDEAENDWTFNNRPIFGAVTLSALPFPIYWTPKRLSGSEAIAALTGHSEPEPTEPF